MNAGVLEDIKVIDTDTHVVEPYDLWTSRVSTKKWGDLVPHVSWDHEDQEDAWFFGTKKIVGATRAAVAGSDVYLPDHKATLAEVQPETWNVTERLKWMDRHGIYAQVLYPNVAGLGTGRFVSLNDPELMLACCRAYNDFLTDFISAAPERFVGVSALPFWDLDATLAEIQRCAAMGHRGVIFGREPEYFGMPCLTHPHWDPLWAAAQDMELSINFHIAAGDFKGEKAPWSGLGPHTLQAAQAVDFLLSNARGIADIITAGIAHRHPNLNFVSVESGVGWIPFALSAMDWFWKNAGVHLEHPEYDLLPSEYFKRQFYGCFYFEDVTVLQAIDILGPNNLLFQTDFPHPASLSPGPASTAPSPRTHIANSFSSLPEDSLRKILHDNAARLYHLDS